jgi:putative phosphonate metabolism protein
MRYAIYYTPPEEAPLSQYVATWLGRNAFTGEMLETTHGLDDLLASPRKYGFHGTLKAPFHLAKGVREDDLIELFDTFAQNHSAFTLPSIQLSKLGPFFALTPSAPNGQLETLGSDAVRTFEPMRAPLSQADIERRNPAKLSDQQRAYLERWGYPYVMDEFRFHLTLTGPVDDADSSRVEEAINTHFEAFLDKPLPIETLGLFAEQERGGPFSVLRVASLL